MVCMECQWLPTRLWEPMPRLLGEKLRYLRTQSQMTQMALAQSLGLAQQGYISNLEAGRKMPSLDLVIQIADLFGVTADYLLRDTIPVEIVGRER
jgi:transcriptional regulator with XRE-family HTH domain